MSGTGPTTWTPGWTAGGDGVPRPMERRDATETAATNKDAGEMSPNSLELYERQLWSYVRPAFGELPV
ncbi:hypothetical protein FHX82_001405 [Amycolatopsis bartoniae]|nr:hypothetical protein [Amycolatopsis bartoniae]